MPPITRSKAAKASSSISTPEFSTARSGKSERHPNTESTQKKSIRQLPVPRSQEVTEPSQTPSVLSKGSRRVLPDNAIVHWPCQSCSCLQGVFTPPTEGCIFCEHNMGEHTIPPSDAGWDPYCDHVSQREGLVTATLRLVLEKGMVVIRATPQVGKTTLLLLLGRHIRDKCPNLEPIWLQWKNAEQRSGLPYHKYLDNEAKHWRQLNAEYRPHNPKARNIFLIDEAQNSYTDTDFWSRQQKNRFTRSQSLFLLVCVYGSTTNYLAEGYKYPQSEALMVEQSQRIELRPSVTSGLCMQFNPKETEEVIQKWAFTNKYKLVGSVSKYMHMATDGHPGMIGLLLNSFDSHFNQLDSEVRSSRAWTPELCHAIIANQAGFMDLLERRGRGVWTAQAETFCRKALLTRHYGEFKFSDMIRVMQHVATKPNGYTHFPTDFDAFALCHKMGFLHTEPSAGPDKNGITYVFASPIHRRIAYRRLLPGPDPDAGPDNRTLLQVCLNAIEGISPSAIQSRSSDRWSVPEATFQDEIYRCLHCELQHLPILSEYSHSSDGRVDFYIFDKKWGVEILQSGNYAQIMEHAVRFGPGGKYKRWNILEDYIVLNFCPKSKLRSLEVQDKELQAHIIQVAIDSLERTAEIYTYDMQLRASFTLGEGRYGSGTGVDNLGIAIGESDALKSNETGPLFLASYEKDCEEARGLMELLESRVPRMSKQEREAVLELLG